MDRANAFSLKRILVPVAFSDRCQDATRYAAALACRFHADLTLMHVFTQPWGAFGSPEGYATPPPYDYESTLAAVQEALDGFLADELKGLSVDRLLAEGDPATEIARYACAAGCGMIVMPTHGYGPFRRFLLGSVTAKILHDVNCPVFTGPHLECSPEPAARGFHKILCALDVAPESRTVLAWAARFARQFDAELSIVHAIPISTIHQEGLYFDPQWRTDVASSARLKIAGWQEEFEAPGAVLVEIGDIPGAVRSAAETTGADLVIAGRTHHGIIRRLRANTYGIVRESCCPVIAV